MKYLRLILALSGFVLLGFTYLAFYNINNDILLFVCVASSLILFISALFVKGGIIPVILSAIGIFVAGALLLVMIFMAQLSAEDFGSSPLFSVASHSFVSA